jgi:hypothetical protein
MRYRATLWLQLYRLVTTLSTSSRTHPCCVATLRSSIRCELWHQPSMQSSGHTPSRCWEQEHIADESAVCDADEYGSSELHPRR